MNEIRWTDKDYLDSQGNIRSFHEEPVKQERVCCNCRHNKRTGELGQVECHCDLDGSYIDYIKCMTYHCKRWGKDRKEEENDT